VIGTEDISVTQVVTDARNAAGSESVSFTVFLTVATLATLVSPRASESLL
jgi:hypothetical protein